MYNDDGRHFILDMIAEGDLRGPILQAGRKACQEDVERFRGVVISGLKAVRDHYGEPLLPGSANGNTRRALVRRLNRKIGAGYRDRGMDVGGVKIPGLNGRRT